MCTHLAALLQLAHVIVHATIRSPDSDMIRLNSEVLQAFLNINTDSRPAAPKPHDEIRPVTALINLHRKAIGVLQQGLFLYNNFLQCMKTVS